MYGKLFASMYDGTLGTKGPWQALVTFQQFVILCDKNGVLDMTAEALARRTSIPLEIIRLGIEALEQPDPDSRTPAEEGRRIVRLDERRSWGWRIVNHPAYSKIRSADDRRTYMRELMQGRRAVDRAVDAVSTVVSTPAPALAVLAHTDIDTDTDTDTDCTGDRAPCGNTDNTASTDRRVEKTDATSALQRDAGAPGVSLERRSSSTRATGLAKRRDASAVAVRIGSLFAEVHADANASLSVEQKRRALSEMVFLYWTARFNHPGALLDAKRERKISQRLKENGDDVSELLYALDGAAHDPWTMGKARESERAYDDIVTIFRDRAQVERFASTRKPYREGTPHKLIPRLEAALRGDGTITDGAAPAAGSE